MKCCIFEKLSVKVAAKLVNLQSFRDADDCLASYYGLL
uniref:Uncharacterized protein n=1 Tax=uncultured bacterium B26B6 TaxID=1329636 RepID=S4W8W6_9BACT|nr:hypothetical protein [uncultured bacterium B26B6]